jgi:hypothetical protein
MEVQINARGFESVSFKDYYEAPCSLQQSSIWLEDDNGTVGGSAIWIGVDDARPRIMAKHAAMFGVETNGQVNGWVDYPLPEEVSLTTRMHLNREQVAAIIPLLQNWLDTGSFEASNRDCP